MIEQDEFLEYMCVFGKNHYGTPRAYVEEQRALGNDVILEIDVQGALSVKQRCADAVMIFIAPPSLDVLKKRLAGRGTETQEAIERRFAEAERELAKAELYDYVIINDSLNKAVEDMESVFAAERLRTANNPELINNLKGA